MGRRPRLAEDVEGARHKVLDEAERLLAIPDGTFSLAKVAEAVGATKGAVFHHFPSKRLLLLGVAGRFISELETYHRLHAQAGAPEALAYVSTVFDTLEAPPSPTSGLGYLQRWAALDAAARIEPDVRRAVEGFLGRSYQAAGGDITGLAAMLAADGLWERLHLAPGSLSEADVGALKVELTDLAAGNR